jgi:hypothetical protein
VAFTDEFYRDELSLFLLEEFIVSSYHHSTRFNAYKMLLSEFQTDMPTFYKLIKMDMKDALMFDFISQYYWH